MFTVYSLYVYETAKHCFVVPNVNNSKFSVLQTSNIVSVLNIAR